MIIHITIVLLSLKFFASNEIFLRMKKKYTSDQQNKENIRINSS